MTMMKARCMSVLSRLMLIVAIMPAACSGGMAEKFVHDASVGNQFEILSSQLAMQKSQNDEIKQFAQKMIDDHTQIANRLASLPSSTNGMPQPTQILDAAHQRMLDRLSSSSDFDRGYVNMQVDAHNAAVALFSDYAKNGGNEDLKKFASDTLPMLQQHQQLIMKIQSSLSTP